MEDTTPKVIDPQSYEETPPKHPPRRKLSGYKFIGRAFYPLQYLVAHLYFFGFTIDPAVMVYRAAQTMNWAELVEAFWAFRHPFIQGFNFLNLLVPIVIIIFWNIPRLIWAARYIIIFAFVVIYFLKFLWYCGAWARFRRSITLEQQVHVNEGAPGTGKTRLATIVIDILAGLMWQKVLWQRWRDKRKVKRWIKQNNKVKLKEYDEIEKSYQYYTTPQKIVGDNGEIGWVWPYKGLFSNIGIRKDSMWSSKLTFEHAVQLKRVPSYTISFYSEIGTTYNIEYSTDRILTMSDYARFCRQFFENVIWGDEQDSGNVVKDFRRVTSDIWSLEKCQTVLRPILLLLFFVPLKKFFSNRQRFHFMSGFMTRFEKLINSIGFVRFRYRSSIGGAEVSSSRGVRRIRRQTAIVHVTYGVEYDTRAFSELADCRDHPISGEVHTSFKVENTTENRQSYLRAEFKNRPEVFMTNTNLYEMMKLEAELWKVEELRAALNKKRKAQPQVFRGIKFVLGEDKVPNLDSVVLHRTKECVHDTRRNSNSTAKKTCEEGEIKK